MKKIWFLLKFFEPKRCKIWNVMNGVSFSLFFFPLVYRQRSLRNKRK